MNGLNTQTGMSGRTAGGIPDFRTYLDREWDADSIATDPITSWLDTVAADDMFVEPVYGVAPAFESTSFNGHDAAFFSATDEWLTSAYSPTNGDFTIFGVAQGIGTPDGYERIFDASYTGSFWMGYDAAGGTAGWCAGCLQSTPPYRTLASTSVPFTDAVIIAARRNNTNWTVYLNGTALSGTDTVASTALDGSPLSIGNSASRTTDRFNGRIANCRYYAAALSDTEIEQVFAFLGDRYGITITN